MVHMKAMQYIVQRFHSPSISFPTLAQAEEFALNCGDFSGIDVQPAFDLEAFFGWK
tara:strand:+ start:1161 stop:1328 length:168 start_codon:yes stop_codon:yes gene_type:complete